MKLAHLAVLSSLALTLSGGVAHAAGATYQVSDGTGFAAAVAGARGGDTIRLAAGSYGILSVKRHTYADQPLSITGPQGALVDGLKIDQSSGVTVTGISITPIADDRATLAITSSSNVLVDGVDFDGRDELLGTGFQTDGASSNVTLQNSELTNCGMGQRCVGPGATNLVVRRNDFHDCYDCDFIRGGGT